MKSLTLQSFPAGDEDPQLCFVHVFLQEPFTQGVKSRCNKVLARFSGGSPEVLRVFSGGSPGVLRRFSGGSTKFFKID